MKMNNLPKSISFIANFKQTSTSMLITTTSFKSTALKLSMIGTFPLAKKSINFTTQPQILLGTEVRSRGMILLCRQIKVPPGLSFPKHSHFSVRTFSYQPIRSSSTLMSSTSSILLSRSEAYLALC